MKTIFAIIITTLLAFFMGEYLPWWSIAIAAFSVSIFVNQSSFSAFLAGFLGVGLLWVGHASWIDLANNSLLSERVASLLHLQGNPVLLITVTGLLGGVIGGLAALSANFLVRAKQSGRDPQNYYRSKSR